MIFNGTSSSGGVEIVTGQYTGTGTSKTQEIKLGFRPKAVLVATRTARGNYYDPQNMQLVVDGGTAPSVEITDTGFKVKSYFNGTNSDGYDINPLRYIAFK